MSPAELKTQMEGYLAMRQAAGYRYHLERPRLLEFIDFVIERGQLDPIRAQAAIDWACSSCRQGRFAAGKFGRAERLGVVRRFLKYLQISYPNTEAPPYGVLDAGHRPAPYLFSETDIARLLQAASQAPPRNGLRPHTLHTLLGLLASTGLRIGEAMGLTIADVRLDAEPPHLFIREAKFRKSRLVPLHSTTVAKLREYAARCRKLGFVSRDTPFFVSEKGPHPTSQRIRLWFWRLTKELEMRPADGKRWACLHSFRHTFAVSRLKEWYRQGADINTLLQHLSVYLGHVRPQDTYWYLTATPELLGTAAERFESYALPGGEL